jgi:hypothetical protein
MTDQQVCQSRTIIPTAAVAARQTWPKALLALACIFALADTGNTQAVTALVDGGGNVMQSPTIFLIFWLPTGFHYDSTGTAAADTTYEGLMGRFFTDVSGSAYLNILSQYPGTCGPPIIATQTPCFGAVTLGGTTVDTHAYPHAGTTADPLSDADMQTEVSTFITGRGLTPGFNTEFFVFLGNGAVTCLSVGNCDNTFPGFCAYHSAFTTTGATAGTAIYGVMPNLNSLSGCDESISSGPNQLAADREIIALSHEFSESMNDPVAGGWRSITPPFREIGDNCNTNGNPVLGNIASNGSNITINGHPYVLQTEWSNDVDNCIISFVNNLAGRTVQNTFTTGSDDLRGNSDLTAVLQANDGSSQGTIGKVNGQPGWDSSAPHVRVSSMTITAPLQQELLTLISHNDLFQTNDHWNIQSIDLKLRNPNGTIICEQVESGTPLASITDGSPATFPTPNCLPPPPKSEAVTCSVFDDGYTNVAGPSGAVYINSNMMHACIPDNTGTGTCRKWFGRCKTVQSNVPVFFFTFDDGSTNKEGPSDAVYINAFSTGIEACLPAASGAGLCHKWFGEGFTSDGRSVTCAVFDDGDTNPTFLSDAIYVRSINKNTMNMCVPDSTSNGICRKWFGTCQAQ